MKVFFKYQSISSDGRYIWETKSFDSQAELFRHLVTNKEDIFAQKKSVVKRCEGGLSCMPAMLTEDTIKAKPVYENDFEKGVLKRTVVTNTYWWMDSHSDVHIGRDGGDTAIFSESIKGRESKIYPIDQHNWSLDGKMGKTLSLYEAPISWRALGVGKTGMTESLFAVAQIEKAKNEKRYEEYKNDEIDQHSVGMRYVDVQLAVNDPDEYPKEFQVWQKYIGKLGNRQEAEKQGYFFPVIKAQLLEYSAVIAGSNTLTPTLGGSGGAGASEETKSGRTEVRDERLIKALETLKITL